MMGIYSLLLGVALGVSAPWWMWRMVRSGRYREGLRGRLGVVPRELREAVAGTNGRVVWVHAVSVGEVLAVERLVGELQRALAGWVVVISTTTAAGQAVARKRLAGVGGFYLPLDFGFAVRRYLRVLRPALLVLVESEFWPRLLVECGRAGVKVAVVNARVSDRSFPRYMRLRWVWRRVLGRVGVFLAQGEESAGRLRALGVERVRVVGNLKYDLAGVGGSRVAELIRVQAARRPVFVAGSTVGGKARQEEELVLRAMEEVWREMPEALLVLAPRHPERFGLARSLAGSGVTSATELLGGLTVPGGGRQTILLDTVGDLAAVYELACVAFVGGSLVAKGGHNPLEAARFGVPVVMGGSYENFREMVEGMRAEDAIRMVDGDGLGEALIELAREGRAMGERGRRFYEAQAGASGRTVAALLELVGGKR